MITLKTPEQIALMREAGRAVARTLRLVSEAAAPGVTLRELDEVAARCIKEAGARSVFLDYRPDFAPVPYPAVLCTSLNEVVVHGPPTDRALRDGDLLSIDFALELDGFCADSARTLSIGDPTPEDRRLSDTTREALDAAIAACLPGNRMGDIGHAAQQVIRAAGYGTPAEFGGHGIGRSMHEDPGVPNTGRPGRGLTLREGLVLALEPMCMAGGRDGIDLLPDGWSIVSADGSRAAHWEHTVALTADGPQVLTVE
jgi:methionyl aminopeptidase